MVQANGRCNLKEKGQAARFPGVIVDLHDRKLMAADLQGLKNKEFLDELQAQVISENHLKVLKTGRSLEIEELPRYRDVSRACGFRGRSQTV
jgi:hypothetical protein